MRLLFLPHLLFLQRGWMGGRLEMQRPISEDFREQDLNINILGVSLCFDIGISCF